MSKHKHQKRKKNKLTLVFPLFLILLAFSGMYAEHSYPEHHATKKSSTPATKTTTDLTNQQPIEPKNATSAGIEQLLVEKNWKSTILIVQQGHVKLKKA